MTGSAGQKRVHADFFSRYKVALPPITLQNQFAEKIFLIEKQKELAKQSLQESENLFNALLQKAFKGELVNSV
jgi:type I restriction enzyme S subunit